jgi:hypothetical protein
MGLEESIKDLGYFEVGDLSTKEAFARIGVICKEHNFDTVIIDSVGPALEGDMSAAKDVIGFHRTYITPLRGMGITPILIDHQARAYSEDEYQGKGAFGSSYKEHLARSVYQVQARGYDEETGALVVRMRHKKANFTKLEKPFDLWVSFTDDDTIKIERIDVDDAELITERSVGLEQRILSALKSGPGDAHDICDRVQGNIGHVRNTLTKMKKANRVVEAGKEGKAIIYDLPGSSSSSHPLRANEDDERQEPMPYTEDFG